MQRCAEDLVLEPGASKQEDGTILLAECVNEGSFRPRTTMFLKHEPVPQGISGAAAKAGALCSGLWRNRENVGTSITSAALVTAARQ